MILAGSLGGISRAAFTRASTMANCFRSDGPHPARRRARPTTERVVRFKSSYSVAFGAGPIWIRSPKYDPMRVNITPIIAMIAYMKPGSARTVW